MNTLNEDIEMVRRGAAGVIAGAALSGMLIGGVVGAVIALLFAPSSGEETRAEIRQKAIELGKHATETAKGTVSQAKSKAEEIKINVRDKAAEIKQRGQELVNE